MPSEKISVLLPHDLLELAQQAAAAGGETLDQFVRTALTDRLSRLTTASAAARRRAAAAEWSD